MYNSGVFLILNKQACKVREMVKFRPARLVDILPDLFLLCMDFLIVVQDLHLQYLPSPLNTLAIYEMSFTSSPLSAWLGALYRPLIANMLLALTHCAFYECICKYCKFKILHHKQQ